MFGLKRWRERRKHDRDEDVDEQTRRENDTYRATHDTLILDGLQSAADRWQRRSDNEFKRPYS